MFRLTFILRILALLGPARCCSGQKQSLPARPDKADGWKEVQGNGYVSIGRFVLGKGESTDSRDLGVKVVDIVPPNSCAEPASYAGLPKAILWTAPQK
jgi:hypothetical protein